MGLLDWFKDRRALVRRIEELERGIYEIGHDLAEKRIMFQGQLAPDYFLFTEEIIMRMSRLRGEKQEAD